ncbi:hypothetical protein JKA74_01285 [Marivirga sp. S37H4]|uniref:Uncharacterized protein n=1 Tax=Marivirga aurantiaca TaxID=2802615 RepID=A0A935C548_9BACT|nr:hypothetical protein [Marivirga aurantiaca]MBK6263651.1 hypothetical protein [Marivirga aurantiaca]
MERLKLILILLLFMSAVLLECDKIKARHEFVLTDSLEFSNTYANIDDGKADSLKIEPEFPQSGSKWY